MSGPARFVQGRRAFADQYGRGFTFLEASTLVVVQRAQRPA